MKKYLIILAGLSFLFFSCASKPDSTAINESAEDLTATEVESESETPEVSDKEITNENSDEDSEIVDVSDEEYLAELEELSDPEVTDLEYVEVTETEKDNKSAEEVEQNFELVPQEEVLAVTEKIDSDKSSAEKITKTKTENKKDDDEIIDLTNSDSPEDIIEIMDEYSDANPEEVEPVIIIPSRKVTLKIGQTLEVMYPGSGWIYMGTTDSTKDFTFLGKKLGTQNTKFTFTAKSEGTKILHFYKNDALTEKVLDDYLEVEITNDKDTAKATVSAPAYKQPVPVSPKEKKSTPVKEEAKSEAPAVKETPSPAPVETKKAETATPAAAKTIAPAPAAKSVQPKVEEKTETADQDKPAEILSDKEVQDLLKQARTLYENKDYKNALNKLSQFFEYSTSKRDEAFYLQGQIYEAAGTTKNIKLAIEAYKNVTKNYPASPYWDDANKRIIYLTKFYLEGR